MLLLAIYVTCMVCNLFLVRFVTDNSDESTTFVLCGLFSFPIGLFAAMLALYSNIHARLQYRHNCNKLRFLIEQFNNIIR